MPSQLISSLLFLPHVGARGPRICGIHRYRYGSQNKPSCPGVCRSSWQHVRTQCEEAQSNLHARVVFLPKFYVDTPVQCSFNMKNQQVRKHTGKSTYFYLSNFGENTNVFLQYDFVKMLIFEAFLKFFYFFVK